MDRLRLTAALLALLAFGLCLRGIDAQGLWFDEAYTARIAALSPERLLRGALADIHPPLWPMIAGASLRLPLPPEIALRLPSTLAFTALVGVLALRNPLLGLGVIFAAPLVDQATQGRPYLALALALTLCTKALARGRWGWGGLAAGVAASLHALGGALVAPVVVAHALLERPGRRSLLRGAAAFLGVVAWWLPAFGANALNYLGDPWYMPSDPGQWWTLTDGWTGLLGLLGLLAFEPRTAWRRLLPAITLAGTLVALEATGVGVEVRKTGIVVLPVLLAALTGEPRAWKGPVLLVAGLALGSVRLDDRPDLREARDAVAALTDPVPVVSVFASEAAWYLRTPAPLPSRREPDGIAVRIREVVTAQEAPCVVAIHLPGTFPQEEALGPGLRTHAVAAVTGLDVRLVGREDCAVEGDRPPWRPVEGEMAAP